MPRDNTGEEKPFSQRRAGTSRGAPCAARGLFRLLASSCEEDFEFFARAEKTVQLASLEASAYTELPRFIFASPDLFSMIRQGLMRRRGHVFHGQPARHELSPQKASFLYRHTSRWRIFGRAFLVQQFRAGQPAEIQRRLARVANDSIPSGRGMGSDFSSHADR